MKIDGQTRIMEAVRFVKDVAGLWGQQAELETFFLDLFQDATVDDLPKYMPAEWAEYARALLFHEVERANAILQGLGGRALQ